MDPETMPAERDAQLSDFVLSIRGIFRRQWKLMLLVGVPLFLAGMVGVLLFKPKYEAFAQVQIDPSRNPMASAADEQTGLASEAIDTEATVIGSPQLALDVVRRLKLDRDPEFTKGLDDDATPMKPDERLNKVTAAVLKRLDVEREKLTYVITIKFKSEDAEKSALIANTFAKAYIDTRVGTRIGTAQSQAEYFKEQLGKLGADLSAAQQRAAEYRANVGIAQSQNTNGGTVTDQQIAPLSLQVATAQAAAAAAQSNVDIARKQVATGGIDAVSEVRNSLVIGELRKQLAEVERTRNDVESHYGPKHPDTISVNSQVASLNAQIAAEANRVIGSLQANANAAKAQAESLKAALTSLRGQEATDYRSAAHAAAIDQEVATRKDAYDRMSQMSLASTQSQTNSIASAEIVDVARTPTKQAMPNQPVLALLAAAAALAIGIASGFLRELISSGFRTIGDVEGTLGIPVVGALPRLSGKRVSPAAQLVADPTSMYAECLRNTRTSIVGLRAANAPRIVAITSALPAEGKSTAALSLARVSALGNHRTLLVECDLRHGSQGRILDVEPAAGLVEVLRDGVPVEHAIIADVVPALDLLLISKPFFSTEDLFGEDRLHTLLSGLRDKYTLIVLDLPPVLGLADARTIAVQADAVILVIRWSDTAHSAVEQALAALRGDGARVTGAILTQVDPNSEAVGGTYYSSKYASYYKRPKPA
jgi:capsular exopolysaccharide synthesis family protein